MISFVAPLAMAATLAFGVTSVMAQTEWLVVNPDSAPVGTAVILDGFGCNNPGHPAYFMFGNQGERSGTVGGQDFTVAVDSTGHFKTTYTIPLTLAPYQGRGGGNVIPGTYAFYSFPPSCITSFDVLPTSLARGGVGLAPLARIGGAALVCFGVLLLALGQVASRRLRAHAQPLSQGSRR